MGKATGGQSDSLQIAGGSMTGRNNACFSRGMSQRLQVTWLLTFEAEWGGTPSGMGTGVCAWGRLIKPISETSGWVTEQSNQKGWDSYSQTQGQTERARPWGMEWTSGDGAGSTTELGNAVGGWQWDSGRQARVRTIWPVREEATCWLFLSPPPLLPTRHLS